MSLCQTCTKEAHGVAEHRFYDHEVPTCDDCARRRNVPVRYPEGLASCDNCGLIDHTPGQLDECLASMRAEEVQESGSSLESRGVVCTSRGQQGPQHGKEPDMDKNLETRIVLLRGAGMADRVIAAQLGISIAKVRSVK